MKRVALLALVCVASLAATGDAQADHWAPGACGLPPALPLHVEYAEGAVSARILYKIFGPARPPLVLATSGRNVPGRLRRLGAHTIFWEMKIQHLLGTTTAPGNPATIDAAADRLYQRAVNATACATPSIALNELNGAWLSTPWSPTNTQYRANTLQLLRRLHSRGAHPYLMVTTSPPPFTATPEAADWWRQAAAVSDLVLQVHFDGRFAYRRGPIVGSRLRRMKMRRALDQFTGTPTSTSRRASTYGLAIRASATVPAVPRLTASRSTPRSPRARSSSLRACTARSEATAPRSRARPYVRSPTSTQQDAARSGVPPPSAPCSRG
jgi:hypothetical protein